MKFPALETPRLTLVTLGKEDASSVFNLFSDENIEFKHCNTCGCVTHYETTEKIKDKK